MPCYFLEGESFFVLSALEGILPDFERRYGVFQTSSSVNLLSQNILYVYIDPSKDDFSRMPHDNVAVCLLDKNSDLRLDYFKKFKAKSTHHVYEPIPSTDFDSLLSIFGDGVAKGVLPVKNGGLKYKGQKQNYEWFDLSLISDLIIFDDVFQKMDFTYFDIWSFNEGLFSGNPSCLNFVDFINDGNFEYYYNRIREGGKDYIDFMAHKTGSFYQYKSNGGIIQSEYRFQKVKNDLSLFRNNEAVDVIMLFDECLKNVRCGSNPKIELINLFWSIKLNAK